jgi:hypothetical protein
MCRPDPLEEGLDSVASTEGTIKGRGPRDDANRSEEQRPRAQGNGDPEPTAQSRHRQRRRTRRTMTWSPQRWQPRAPDPKTADPLKGRTWLRRGARWSGRWRPGRVEGGGQPRGARPHDGRAKMTSICPWGWATGQLCVGGGGVGGEGRGSVSLGVEKAGTVGVAGADLSEEPARNFFFVMFSMMKWFWRRIKHLIPLHLLKSNQEPHGHLEVSFSAFLTTTRLLPTHKNNSWRRS